MLHHRPSSRLSRCSSSILVNVETRFTLYISRITDEKDNRRYERVNRRKPQLNGGVYCLDFYENGKRKCATIGTYINTALKAKMEKGSELRTRPGGQSINRRAEVLRGTSNGIYPRQKDRYPAAEQRR